MHQADFNSWKNTASIAETHPWKKNRGAFWFLFSVFTSAGINYTPPASLAGEIFIMLCFPATIIWSIVAFAYNLVWASILDTNLFVIHAHTRVEKLVNVVVANFSLLHFISLVLIIFITSDVNLLSNWVSLSFSVSISMSGIHFIGWQTLRSALELLQKCQNGPRIRF